MANTYHRRATVRFAINGTEQHVSVHNIPYCVTNGRFDRAEQEVVFDAIKILRSMGDKRGLSCISVETTPEKADA